MLVIKWKEILFSDLPKASFSDGVGWFFPDRFENDTRTSPNNVCREEEKRQTATFQVEKRREPGCLFNVARSMG